MTPILKKRATHLTEKMEDPDCDREKLFNTYRQFSHLNRLITRWKSLFLAYIAPLAEFGRPLRILDIGCGGGDICLKLSKWAGERNLNVEITGIDPDPRAMEFIRQLEVPENVEFRQANTDSLIRAREQYDVVLSNHLVHHLQITELLQICKQAEILSTRLVLFNDIRRSDFGFAAFGITAPVLFRSSFIYRDGLKSIRRSFIQRELKQILPENWQVKKLFPFRLLMICEQPKST